MEIDFTRQIIDLDGMAVPDGDSSFLTLRTVCTTALLSPHADDQNLSPDKKFERFQLAQRIHTEGVVDLKSEQIAEIKKLIARGYAPLVIGRAFEILEGTAPELEPAKAAPKRAAPNGTKRMPAAH